MAALYVTTQAYNYKKREEAFITSTSKEEAIKNAHKLIESEEMVKLKAEQKWAKKKRQKEKKKAEKAQSNQEEKNTLPDSLPRSENNVNNKSNKSQSTKKSEDESSECCDQENHTDDEFLDVNAAFIKISTKRNKNNILNKTSISKPKKTSPPLDSMSISLSQSTKQENTKSQSETAETLAMQSCNMILNNDFVGAIDLLSKAISRTPEDVRHFLNRSYCYLRLGQYTLALKDAQFARRKSELTDHLAKAIAREGQALYGLQQYYEAEKCFEQIAESVEVNQWILTELVLARASQLTNMGFSRTNALKALQRCSAVFDAITLLTSESINNSQSETNRDDLENESCDGDEIYFSDDESSNTIFLSKLVSTITDKYYSLENLRPQSSASNNNIQPCSSSLESTSKSSISTESLPHSNDMKTNDSIQWEVQNNLKSVRSSLRTQNQRPMISDSATIWVGSVEKSVTEYQLRELFGVYGKINYIRRFSDDRNYVFINFSNKKAATKALNNPMGIEINGVILPVRPVMG